MIQMIGRAARHMEGVELPYADGMALDALPEFID